MTFDRIKRMFEHRAAGGSQDSAEREAAASADRDIPSVNAPRRGSKVTSALALAFIAGMGLYLIYQLNTGATRQEQIAQKKEADVARANAIGGVLPAIMVPPLPQERPVNTLDDLDAPGVQLAGGMLDAPDRPPPPEDTLHAPATRTTPAAAPPPMTPQQAARLRRQRGTLTVELEGDTATAHSAIPEVGAMNRPFPTGAVDSGIPLELASNAAARSQAQAGDELHASLQPTITRATQAAMLPDPSYLITKGAFMDCVLETRIDSSVLGMTSCVLSRPM